MKFRIPFIVLCPFLFILSMGCGTSMQYVHRDVTVQVNDSEDMSRIKSMITRGNPSDIFDSLVKAGFKFDVPKAYSEAYLAIPDAKNPEKWNFTGRACKSGPVAAMYCIAFSKSDLKANLAKPGDFLGLLERSDGSEVPITQDRLLRMMFGTFHGVSEPPYIDGPRFTGSMFGQTVELYIKFFVDGKDDDWWADVEEVDAEYSIRLGELSQSTSGSEVASKVQSMKDELACRLGTFKELYIEEDEKVDGIAVWSLGSVEVRLEWNWSGPGRFGTGGSGGFGVGIEAGGKIPVDKDGLMQRKHMVSTSFIKYEVQHAPAVTKTCP